MFDRLLDRIRNDLCAAGESVRGETSCGDPVPTARVLVSELTCKGRSLDLWSI